MVLPDVVHEFKRAAREIYGSRLHAVVVFGSVARGNATPDSDVDLMLVLRGEVDAFEEIDRLGEVVYDLNVRHKALLAVVPVSFDDYRDRATPLLINVRREGVEA